MRSFGGWWLDEYSRGVVVARTLEIVSCRANIYLPSRNRFHPQNLVARCCFKEVKCVFKFILYFVKLQAYELSTLTGTQVMLLVASETGHVYTFATRKLQPMITSEAGKALIQTCLNSPDPPPSGSSGDQRMSATGFEETELTYNIADDEQKVRQLVYGSPHGGGGLHGGYPNAGGPPGGQHGPSPHAQHAQHAHLIAHAHAGSPSSHLVPCSSPGPMLAAGPYQQSCPSPLPPPHATYHPHMSHSHPQR